MIQRLSGSTIFLSAFLLFSIQPLIAKRLLPDFGGAAFVWTTCLLFFQAELLLGYLYAHLLARRLTPRGQNLLHGSLLASSLAALPLLARRPGIGPFSDPSLGVVWGLAACVGLPYLALSATSPLLQARLSDSSQRPGSVYRLYSLSNAGSLSALLAYPFLIEPRLTLKAQTVIWACGYGAFVALCLAALASYSPAAEGSPAAEESPKTGEPSTFGRKGLWLALSACSSTLLSAVTNQLTQNVAAAPFLWLLPLTLYLLSFIVCFAGRTWRWSRAFLPFPALAVAAMTYALWVPVDQITLERLVALFSAGFFVCCLVCHGELARLKPAEGDLTAFYLMIALGGALGSLFVALLAPRLFPDFFELPVGIAAVAVLSWWLLYRDPEDRWWTPSWLFLGAAAAVLAVALAREARKALKDYALTTRNFYGVLRIGQSQDESGSALRTLSHGAILHGEQYLDEERRRRPTTYFAPKTGVGLAVREGQSRGPMRVAVIGLGAGTLAAYGRAQDTYRFYELNPRVIALAKEHFSYLRDSGAEIEIVPGDARLSLRREEGAAYDLLVVDAFSGDSIPVHLLTKEAVALYFRLLKPDGVLAVHVTNRYLALEPVVAASAKLLGKSFCAVRNEEEEEGDASTSDWMLVSARTAFFDRKMIKDACVGLIGRVNIPAWTDDYSNLYQVLRP